MTSSYGCPPPTEVSLLLCSSKDVPQLSFPHPHNKSTHLEPSPPLAPPAGSHLLALQLQDAAEGIAGLRQLLHLLLLRLVELGWEVAAVTGGWQLGDESPMDGRWGGLTEWRDTASFSMKG